jgi:hypothetical protein
MIISQYSKKNFYPQSGDMSFSVDLLLDNTTGSCEFGFSGTNLFNFKCKDGKIFDNGNNLFGSYNKYNPISISGDISNNSLDYYFNQTPINFNLNLGTGTFNYFYINPVNCAPNIDFNLNGKIPTYTLPSGIYYTGDINPISVLLNNTSDAPFKIYSGNITNTVTDFTLSGLNNQIVYPNSGINFFLTPSTSGNINKIVNLNLYTNFGTQNPSILLTGTPFSPIPINNIEILGPQNVVDLSTNFYYCRTSGLTEIQPRFDYVTGNVIRTQIYYKDILSTGFYSGIFSGMSPEPFSVVGQIPGSGYSLFLLSGEDNITANVPVYGYASGFLEGHFPITGTITGIWDGNPSHYRSGYFTGLSPLSGYVDNYFASSGIAMGTISAYTETAGVVFGSGYVDGLPSGINFLTGWITGYGSVNGTVSGSGYYSQQIQLTNLITGYAPYSGYIVETVAGSGFGSGYLYGSGYFVNEIINSGNVFVWGTGSEYVSGYLEGFDYVTGLFPGTGYLFNSDNSTIFASGLNYSGGFATGLMQYTGSALFIQDTGVVPQPISYIAQIPVAGSIYGLNFENVINKSFSDTWIIQSGIDVYNLNSLSFISGDNYFSGQKVNLGNSGLIFSIQYNKNLPDPVSLNYGDVTVLDNPPWSGDILSLSISGINSGIATNMLITGGLS